MTARIKATPFIPTRKYRNGALNTDFYEFKMDNSLYVLVLHKNQLVLHG